MRGAHSASDREERWTAGDRGPARLIHGYPSCPLPKWDWQVNVFTRRRQRSFVLFLFLEALLRSRGYSLAAV